MDGLTTLRRQLTAMHGFLETAMEDCPAAILNTRIPQSTINPAGAIYAHTVFVEDAFLNGVVRGQAPLYVADGWSQKLGLEMPPVTMPEGWEITIDLARFRPYASAVYAATDQYLASISDHDLDRLVDAGPAGTLPARDVIGNLMVWHVATHQGEISALKGVQGMVGLVMRH